MLVHGKLYAKIEKKLLNRFRINSTNMSKCVKKVWHLRPLIMTFRASFFTVN